MNRLGWRVALPALAGATLTLALAAAPPTALQAQQASTGQEIYEEHCALCHDFNGQGIPGFTPALVSSPLAQDAEQVRQIVRNGRDTDAWSESMSGFPDLSDADVAAVAAFVQTELAATAVTPPEVTLAPFDDAARARGERLFLGREDTENGSPACVACHAAGRHGSRANTLGVNLTDLFTRYRDAERVMAVVRAPPSAVMRPIFADKALTDDEAHALAAFFEAVSGETAADGADTLVVLGLVGLLVLFGLMVLLMSRPREGYAHRLRREA